MIQPAPPGRGPLRNKAVSHRSATVTVFLTLVPNSRELLAQVDNHMPIVMGKLAREPTTVATDGQRAWMVRLRLSNFRWFTDGS